MTESAVAVSEDVKGMVERLRTFEGGVMSSLRNEAAALLQSTASALAEAHARLEIDRYFDGAGNLVHIPLSERGTIPDGISCRDETIRLQDVVLAEARSALAEMTRERDEARDYLRRMDAVIDDQGVAKSCVNALEDLKNAVHELKRRALAADEALQEARGEVGRVQQLHTGLMAEADRRAEAAEVLSSRQGEVLLSVARIAAEAFQEWDKDNDTRVGKILLALSGRLPGYRADIDEFHAARALVQPEGGVNGKE